MQSLKELSIRYYVDWEVLDAEGINSLTLLNPFDPAPQEGAEWLKQLETLQGHST